MFVSRTRSSQNTFTFRTQVTRACTLILALATIPIYQCLGQQQRQDRVIAGRYPAVSVDSIRDESHPVSVLLRTLADKKTPSQGDGRQDRIVPSPVHDDSIQSGRVLSTNSTAKLKSLLNVNCVEFYSERFLWRAATDVQQRVYHPSTLPVPVKIKEHDEIDEYDAVMTFARHAFDSIENRAVFYALVVDIPSDFNKGQTWRVHDVLNFTVLLPTECWHSEYLLPSQASVTQSRDRIIFYNFGYQPGCSKLVMYNPSSRQLHTVLMSKKHFLFRFLICTYLWLSQNLQIVMAPRRYIYLVVCFVTRKMWIIAETPLTTPSGLTSLTIA